MLLLTCALNEYKMMFLILMVLMVNPLWKCYVQGEDVLLACDEAEVSEGLFCTVSGFQVSYSQNVKISIPNKANQKRFMKFYNSILLYIPAKLFDVFSGLTNFDASHTEIEDIPRNTFSAANSLVTLNLSHNKMEKITSSVFVGAHNLMRLDLSYNRLHTITNLTFRGLSDLRGLRLHNNRLNQLPNDLFDENPLLIEIDLSNNFLEILNAELFNRLLNIQDVNLTNNYLKYFDPFTFNSADTLEYLSLANNQLHEFYLSNNSIIKYLDLADNHLSRLLVNGTYYVLANNNNITTVQVINELKVNVLKLRNNHINDIRNITKLLNLNELDLSYNPIGTPNISTYQRFDYLRHLNLRGTGIKSLAFGMFSKLRSLSILDLSYNNLTNLNLEMFVPSNYNLSTLYVDANNLTVIQGKYSFSSAFPVLKELGISKNRFNCSYLHWLLIPPQLHKSIQLHIEYDNSTIETTHIRDVTCISSMQDDLNKIETDLNHSKELRVILQRSLETIGLHVQELQSHLLVSKVSTIILLILIGLLLIWQYGRRLHAKFQVRHGGAIVYHSNTTVHTHVDQ